jgi:hypothetical protein
MFCRAVVALTHLMPSYLSGQVSAVIPITRPIKRRNATAQINSSSVKTKLKRFKPQ